MSKGARAEWRYGNDARGPAKHPQVVTDDAQPCGGGWRLPGPRQQYRSTGVIFLDLDECHDGQLELFGSSLQIEKMARLYQSVNRIKTKYGKHTLFLGSNIYAHRLAQHEGERGTLPERTRSLLKGETRRKRLGLPMLMEDVS
jgi:hypothetical protein